MSTRFQRTLYWSGLVLLPIVPLLGDFPDPRQDPWKHLVMGLLVVPPTAFCLRAFWLAVVRWRWKVLLSIPPLFVAPFATTVAAFLLTLGVFLQFEWEARRKRLAEAGSVDRGVA